VLFAALTHTRNRRATNSARAFIARPPGTGAGILHQEAAAKVFGGVLSRKSEVVDLERVAAVFNCTEYTVERE
jgi:hypothetical protein